MYIKGTWNRLIDALSQTVFPGEECDEVEHLSQFGERRADGSWVWKDGAGGYQALLKSMDKKEGEKMVGDIFQSLGEERVDLLE